MDCAHVQPFAVHEALERALAAETSIFLSAAGTLSEKRADEGFDVGILQRELQCTSQAAGRPKWTWRLGPGSGWDSFPRPLTQCVVAELYGGPGRVLHHLDIHYHQNAMGTVMAG